MSKHKGIYAILNFYVNKTKLRDELQDTRM